MRRSILTALTALVAIGATVTSAEETKSDPTAIRDYEFFVGEFSRINVMDSVAVVYHCLPDSSGYVRYSGREEFDDAFIFTNNKDKLRIQVFTEDVGKPGLPTLHVYSRFLSEVENGSVGRIQVNKPAEVPNFKVVQIGNGSVSVEGLDCTHLDAELKTGNGTISLIGKCNDAKYVIVGTGCLQADNMKSSSVFCRIMGGGTIGCYASDQLRVRGIGTTKIYYRGNPSHIIKKGGGKLIEIE